MAADKPSLEKQLEDYRLLFQKYHMKYAIRSL